MPPALAEALASLWRAYPGVSWRIVLYVDPEEDWSYPLCIVERPVGVDRAAFDDLLARVQVEAMQRHGTDSGAWFAMTAREPA